MQRTNRAFHVFPVLLDDNTQTLAAGTAQRTQKISEKLAEGTFREGVMHGIGLLIRGDLDPTFTTAPTQLGIASSIDHFTFRAEKGRVMFDLRGTDIRLIEMFEGGGQPCESDPDLNSASTNNFYFSRWLAFSPEGMLGVPSDFAIPVAAMVNSVFELTYGALTAVSADTTAGTLRTRLYLVTIILYEVRVPPKVEKRTYDAGASSVVIGDRSLICSLVLLNDNAHGAIGTGDFDTITLDDRRGNVYSGVPVEILNALYAVQTGSGFLSGVHGEPESATDDNGYIPNGATPTALAKVGALYQPIVWNPPGQRITKIEIESPLTLRWGGTQATGYAVAVRLLPRSDQEAREVADTVFRAAKLEFAGGEWKTLSKKPYKGKRAEYMPQTFKFPKAA